MSHQAEDGWYPECYECDMGNLSCEVICLDCHKKIVRKLKRKIRNLNKEGKKK